MTQSEVQIRFELGNQIEFLNKLTLDAINAAADKKISVKECYEAITRYQAKSEAFMLVLNIIDEVNNGKEKTS